MRTVSSEAKLEHYEKDKCLSRLKHRKWSPLYLPNRKHELYANKFVEEMSSFCRESMFLYQI